MTLFFITVCFIFQVSNSLTDRVFHLPSRTTPPTHLRKLTSQEDTAVPTATVFAAISLTYGNTRESILERNLTNATSVRWLSTRRARWIHITEFILGRNLSNVNIVIKPLCHVRRWITTSIKITWPTFRYKFVPVTKKKRSTTNYRRRIGENLISTWIIHRVFWCRCIVMCMIRNFSYWYNSYVEQILIFVLKWSLKGTFNTYYRMHIQQ